MLQCAIALHLFVLGVVAEKANLLPSAPWFTLISSRSATPSVKL